MDVGDDYAKCRQKQAVVMLQALLTQASGGGRDAGERSVEKLLW
jgi:hypothetical protein